MRGESESVLVDALAQEIRRVDGKHDLGASALAEALMPFISALAPNSSPAATGGGAGAESPDVFEVRLQMLGDGRFYDEQNGEWEMTQSTYEERTKDCQCGPCVQRRALATSSTQPADAVREADGWIEWIGGDCPVAWGAPGSLRFRDGTEDSDPDIAIYNWKHGNGGPHPEREIVAYRLTHPAPEDTARLREDLEWVTRELAEENQKAQSLASDLSGLLEDFSRCQRERDDARKALETIANGDVGGQHSTPEQVIALLMETARSASREGGE